jgi:hypothetical protein
VAVLCAVAVIGYGAVHAASRSRMGTSTGIDRAKAVPPSRDGAPHGQNQLSPLRIQDIRFGVPPADSPVPSTLLMFDMLNDGSSSMTDIAMEVIILRKSIKDYRPRVIFGPLKFVWDDTIEPGDTVSYEVLVQNMASDSDCSADVTITSARVISAPDS